MDNYCEYLLLSDWPTGPVVGSLPDALRAVRVYMDGLGIPARRKSEGSGTLAKAFDFAGHDLRKRLPHPLASLATGWQPQGLKPGTGWGF